MNYRHVSIALHIKDRTVQQLTRSLLESAGSNVLLYDDAEAIKATAERVQAIVLGLTDAPKDTIDAVVTLRKRFKAMPIYVVADAAGQRHDKRIKASGVTEIIPHAALQQRAAQLVGQLAKSAQIDNSAIPAPVWAPNAVDESYDVYSMDLETWLAIPGNRERLLGNVESAAQTHVPAKGPEHADRPPSPEPSIAAQAPPTTATATVNEDELQQPPTPSSLGYAPDAHDSQGHSDSAFADFPLLIKCRAEHAAQNNAILDAHKQREKRLQTAIKTEFQRTMTDRIAASEAKMLPRIDEGVAEVRREVAGAIRRMNLMIGGLAGLVVILAIVFGWLAVTS
ncbi:hypothetical protein Thimo_0671 [Thioflavicoccus mobilis 8321]|uniref:Uncharacterized protein n=1 Tax=Thioflavicoccus mobilis 8321 TaxID=765912 RepID=L0GU69_9GAMM|nr:hypothetical protein [Thioflavicoccus mobilis]AGA89511.1 hypothetical protein Thimo_0671 [Thioflavicoccus mobilis 8321]